MPKIGDPLYRYETVEDENENYQSELWVVEYLGPCRINSYSVKYMSPHPEWGAGIVGPYIYLETEAEAREAYVKALQGEAEIERKMAKKHLDEMHRFNDIADRTRIDGASR